MSNNTNNMNSEEVTRICLAALETLNNENHIFSKNPTTISYVLDNALAKHGYLSNLTPRIDNLEQFMQFHLDHDMARSGFHPDVVNAVRKALQPNPGEMTKIIEELSSKFSKLSISLSAAGGTPLKLMADYQQPMQKVTPYVTAKQISPEAADEYAKINMVGSMEKSLSTGSSNQIHNKLLGEWVIKHPEIPEKVLQDLGLGGIRESQKLFSGPDLSA